MPSACVRRSPAAGMLLAEVLTLAAAPVLTLAAAPAPTGAQEGEEAAAVRAVAHGFAEALAAADSARALRYLHADLRVYEGGHAEDLRAYRSGHLPADVAFVSAMDVETLREEVTVGEGLALYLREYRMRGTYRGREVDSRGTESLVLTRTPAGWRIRHIHWSSR